MGDDLAFHRPLVVEVEVLQRLAGGKTGRANASLGAVGVAGCDFPLQTGGEILLVAPALVAGPLGEPGGRVPQSRAFNALVR